MFDINCISFAEMRKMQFIEQKSEQLKYESECKIKKIQSNGVENEKLIQDLFYKQKELEQQKTELEKREAEFEVDRKKFLAEKERVRLSSCINRYSTVCLSVNFTFYIMAVT